MPPDLFLNPEKVIEEWDIRPGDLIADFGCGAGFFSIPLGKRAGSNGRVYALDIRPEALEAVRAKVKLFHLFNIEPSRANLELERGSGLKSDTIDKVVIANILFQAENKKNIIEEAHRILKPSGVAIVVEWNEGEKAGPVLPNKIHRDEIAEIFKEAGFSLAKKFNAGTHHYGLIFKK
ncbi:MAG: methyltransferase domain-containing protein [Patescibacteria group bacterium]